MTEERCYQCDEPTGHAGRSDDSLFIEIASNEIGPFCSTCYHKLNEHVAAFVLSLLVSKATAADDSQCITDVILSRDI